MQQTSPIILQSLSVEQRSNPLAGWVHTFWGVDKVERTHACPIETSQLESSLQNLGQSEALRQVCPAVPRSQQSSPALTSQSWSNKQSLVQVALQNPVSVGPPSGFPPGPTVSLSEQLAQSTMLSTKTNPDTMFVINRSRIVLPRPVRNCANAPPDRRAIVSFDALSGQVAVCVEATVAKNFFSSM